MEGWIDILINRYIYMYYICIDYMYITVCIQAGMYPACVSAKRMRKQKGQRAERGFVTGVTTQD